MSNETTSTTVDERGLAFDWVGRLHTGMLTPEEHTQTADEWAFHVLGAHTYRLLRLTAQQWLDEHPVTRHDPEPVTVGV